jgi:MFS transporter, OFA family, oxalate/formate antiporter
LRRYAVLCLSALTMCCLGGVFGWSEFVPHLRAQYGLTTAQTQAVFGTTIAVFASAMVLAGRLQERYGPRRLAMAGGLLLGAGYIAASYSGGRFWPMLAGMSLLEGSGLALAYLSPIAVCVRLFPARGGGVTGLIVAGFGGGAILLANVVRPLLEGGADVLLVLRGVGVAYGIAVMACACAMPDRLGPSASAGPEARPLTGILRQPAVWLHAGGMFCGTFAGLMVTGNIRPMAASAGVEASAAGLVVSALAVGNAVGRIGWGAASDRIGWRSVPLSLAGLAVSCALLLPAARNGLAFSLVTVAVGIGFGSCFVVHAAQVVARWGAPGLANVYPVVFLAYGLSGLVGPAVGGRIYDVTGSYAGAVGLAVALAALGACATCALGLGVLRGRAREP